MKELALKLEDILQADADEILTARTKAVALHNAKDLSAGGAEVEIAVRNLLSRKLGNNFSVGHGHIVDSKLEYGPQMDVVVADLTAMGALFRGANGTEFFPYESVYAVGEVKSGYYKSQKEIHKFVKTLAKQRSLLKRADVPPNYIRTGSTGFTLSPQLSLNRAGIQNPLFAFMFFVEGNSFKVEDVDDLYNSHQPSELPNFICFLNKGIIVNAVYDADEVIHDLKKWTASPHIVNSHHKLNRGLYIEFAAEANCGYGLNLGLALCQLLGHVSTCTVQPAPPMDYFNSLLISPPI